MKTSPLTFPIKGNKGKMKEVVPLSLQSHPSCLASGQQKKDMEKTHVPENYYVHMSYCNTKPKIVKSPKLPTLENTINFLELTCSGLCALWGYTRPTDLDSQQCFPQKIWKLQPCIIVFLQTSRIRWWIISIMVLLHVLFLEEERKLELVVTFIFIIRTMWV